MDEPRLKLILELFALRMSKTDEVFFGDDISATSSSSDRSITSLFNGVLSERGRIFCLLQGYFRNDDLDVLGKSRQSSKTIIYMSV